MTFPLPTGCLWIALAASGLFVASGDVPLPPRSAFPENPPPGTAAEIPGDAFALEPPDWIPDLPQPRLLPVRFPDSVPVAQVTRIARHSGWLWMAAVPRGDTNLPPDAGRLWAFDPARNRLLPVRGLVEQNGVFDLLGRRDGLWMALDGGIAALDPSTLQIAPFGPAQGVTSSTFAGIASAGDRVFALAATGAGYALNRDGRSWGRINGDPAPSARHATRWSGINGAGDWLLARAPDALSLRHQAGSAWHPVDSAATRSIPSPSDLVWNAAEGDGDGAFWIGSSAGLHFLVAETASMEHHVAALDVRVPGGFSGPIPAGFQPSATAALQVAERMADGIRIRMRDRARIARQRIETGLRLDPVTPTSRIPGPVTALAADPPYLWLVTPDATQPSRSRVLLFHAGSRRWVGGFGLGLPVRDMAVDDRYLWLALDATATPRGAPLVAVDKRPLTAIPADQWVEDTPGADAVDAWTAGLAPTQRAVLAFFAGDARTVVELLGPSAREHPDPESLFLLAFAHDPIGLDSPQDVRRHLERLHALFPQSPHALATRHLVRPHEPVAAPETPVAATKQADNASPEATDRPDAAAPPIAVPTVPAVTLPVVPVPGTPAPTETDPATILARRDLNRDGRLNLIEWRLWRGPDSDLKAADTNGDGQVDPDELAAVLRAGR